ncbi:MAG: TonB-dependent receptor [Reyranella sp.]|uniref:TonB-dependent receptor n=1 Tax=Reyranella sp. TaxID=1929291 RepID=UPI0012120FD7|nr:TonB-dependent receptor [Reyranella sp.]TAJ93035.1 MAG: TonB-dependent receptor [Reyranella sp.]
MIAQSDVLQLGQAAPQRAFNIPAQSLERALILFGQQSGRQIAADGTMLRGVSTSGVQGTMSVEEALRRLLAGTGLTYSGIDGGTITLQRVAQIGGQNVVQLDPVQVQGFPVPLQAMIDNIPPPYAGGQVATGSQLGLLGNRGVMDTPFNQTSYTAKKVQDQQAKTIQDALIDDPSVRTGRSENTTGSDLLKIRGFNVDIASAAYGGLYGMLPLSSPNAELAERVEVLKGPSAMLNGMAPGGFIGGTVNVVAKRAPDEPLSQATANYLSAGQFGGHVDVARRFGEEKQFGIRLNTVFRAGQTDLQYNSDQRFMTVLGLDYRGERVRLSADLGYQDQYRVGVTPFLALAAGANLPWAPPARNNPTAQPWSNSYRKDLFGVVRGEVDLAENVTAYAAFGAHDYRNMGNYSLVTIINNFNGASSSFAPQSDSFYQINLTGEVGVRALAQTGPVGHELALTATGFWSTLGNGSVQAPGGTFATSIYNPTIIAQPNIPTPASNKTSSQGLTSIGIADTLSAADGRVQLTAGARLQQVQATNFNAVSGAATSSYDQSAISPSVALVFKPWEKVSLYGNFIQGLQQGSIVGPGFTNAGTIFPPFKSTQFEAGVKVDWGKLTTTASIFQISQPSILTNLATNTQYLGGEQVNQGFEFNFFGEVTEGFRVLGGFMLLNAVLTKTQGGLTDGWIAPFSPGAQFNLGAEWDLPFVRGLTLNSRFVYTGTQYFDTLSPRRQLPEWTRFDLGVRYAFDNPGAAGKLLVARLNVENVLDRSYWAGGTNTLLNLGAPRSFRLSLTADF